MPSEQLAVVLLLGAVVVLAAIASVRMAHRLGMPALLIFLGFGLALGEAVIGVRFDNAGLAESLGLSALVLILAEGGLTARWSDIRKASPTAALLATGGVAVSIAVVAVAAHLLINLNWQLSLLLGAVLAPTDAAAVFSVLRRVPLPRRLAGALEAESGFNDAPSVIAVALFSVTGARHSPVVIVGTVGYELLVGALVGVAIGWLGARALRRVTLPASGLYPISVLALVVGGYGAASLLHASGFLAVYVAALVLGNMRLPYRSATRGFAGSVAWLAQIGLFVMLGLLADPQRLPREILPAVMIGAVLVLVARPLAVALTSVLRVRPRDQVLLAWAGLRGAVPIVLATIPMSGGVPGATRLFDLVFVISVLYTLVQGPTLPWVARKLRLAALDEPVELDIEAAPLEELRADMLQIRVPEASKLEGVEIFELRLPQGASVTLVVRQGRSFVPGADTRLSAGDQLLIVTTSRARESVERRLRAVSRAGRLAGWFGERGH